MSLKKPSDLFGEESQEENGIPIVEVSEENFDNVFNVFSTYKQYLDDFENKLESVNYLSEQITSLKEDLDQTIRKEDLDKAILAQLLYVNESISNIENNVKTINEEKLTEIRNDSEYLLKKVEAFVDEDLPRHKKKITEFEFKVEEELKKSNEVVNSTKSSVTDIEETLEKTLDETKEYFDDYDNRIEYIENYLKKSKLGSFKKYLDDKVSRIRDDVNINETKIRNQIREVENVKKDIYEALENLKVESLQKEINSIRSLNKDILDTVVDKVKSESIKANREFSQKINNLEKIYESIEINDKYLREQDEKRNAENTHDPLTPLDKKYATLDDLQNHYRLFISRIQQQLTSLGGGGETRFKYLDDISFDTSNPESYDGRFLTYNASTDGFEFAEPETAFSIGVDGPYTFGQVGIGTSSIQSSPYPDNSLLVWGNARIVGIFTVGEASITLDPNTGRIASGDIEVVSEDGGATYTGTVQAGQISVGVRSDENVIISCGETGKGLITSPAELIIDPAAINNNTGIVRIKGDLIVEGSETKIESQVLEVADKNIGIASTSTPLNDSQLDGAGIIIHGSEGDKSLIWDNSNSRLGFSTDVYAPRYFGDGSNLTGIFASSSIKQDGSTVGSATTFNFSTNLTAVVSAGIATISANIGLGDLSNVDTSNIGAGATNYLLVYDPTIPGFKFVSPQSLGINNDYNPDPLIDDFGSF